MGEAHARHNINCIPDYPIRMLQHKVGDRPEEMEEKTVSSVSGVAFHNPGAKLMLLNGNKVLISN